LTVTDPQKQLVDPAVKGTLNVLNSCKKSKRLRRVVLTSSMAAVTDSPNGILNEDVWNVKSSLTRNPYFFSKSCAEREAWKFVSSVGSKSQKLEFDLVVINPWLIMGPAFDKVLNESNKVILDLLEGKYPVIMSLDFSIVDVRDVARAHIVAAESHGCSGRYITCDPTNVVNMKTLCEVIARDFPQYSGKLPSTNMDCGVGNFLLKGAAHFQPDGVADFLKCNIGKKIEIDNSKIKKDMDFVFTPYPETLRDTINNLIEVGHYKVNAV